jgi:hypothetical protein
MIRLLIVLLIVGLAAYYMLNRESSAEKPEVIYKEELDKVKGLEQQMIEDAAKRMEEADRLSQ